MAVAGGTARSCMCCTFGDLKKSIKQAECRTNIRELLYSRGPFVEKYIEKNMRCTVTLSALAQVCVYTSITLYNGEEFHSHVTYYLCCINYILIP